MQDISRYLTVGEAAVLLRRFTGDGLPSTDSIRGLLARGVLTRCKIGRAVLIDRSEIDALLHPATHGHRHPNEKPRRGRPRKMIAG